MRWMRPIIALACVGAAIWQVRLLVEVLGGSDSARVVETAVVQRGPFAVGFTRDAMLHSADVTQVRATRYGGRLTWVIADGVRVKKGDVLARFEVGELETQLATLRLRHQEAARQVTQEQRERTRDYESAGMDVEKALRALEVLGQSQRTETEEGKAQVAFDRWSLDWSNTDFDKQSRLSREGIVPVSTMEQSERQLRSRQFALAKSEKNLSYLDAEHSVQKAQGDTEVDGTKFQREVSQRRISEAVKGAAARATMLKRSVDDMQTKSAAAVVRAPREGLVVLTTTWGQGGMHTLRPGDDAWRGQKICDITQLSSLDARLRVEETLASRLKLGQEAWITIKGLPKRGFKGKITGIGAISREIYTWEDPDAVSGQRMVDVTVQLLDADARVLQPGIKARVQLVFRRVPQAVYVPLQAIFDRGSSKIAYVQQERRFLPRPITIGARNDEAAQVISGLQPGERVALSDPTRAQTE